MIASAQGSPNKQGPKLWGGDAYYDQMIIFPSNFHKLQHPKYKHRCQNQNSVANFIAGIIFIGTFPLCSIA